jgi:hypothetical protein
MTDPTPFTPTLQAPPATANQLASLRAYAEMLKKGHQPWGNNPRYTIGNGLDRVTGDVMSGLLSNKADVAEQGAIQNIQNASAPPTQAATGGAAPTAPFSVASSPTSSEAGSNPNYTARVFKLESGGDPYNVTGSNRGLAQFGPEEERKYGINNSNRHLPEVQAAALARETKENTPRLVAALGRQPTDAELYITHQQGAAGGPALLANPTAPAWQAIRQYYPNENIAKKAITGNIPTGNPLRGVPVDQITAGDFVNMWKQKYGGGSSAPSTAVGLRSPTEATTETPQAPQAATSPAEGPEGMPASALAFNTQNAPQATPRPPQGQSKPTIGPKGLPNFFPPMATIPANMDQQIRAYLGSPDPHMQEFGRGLVEQKQKMLSTIESKEVGGIIYQGNPFIGYKSTGMPAKKDLIDTTQKVGDIERKGYGNTVYDAQGNPISVKEIPIDRGGPAPSGAPRGVLGTSPPGSQTGAPGISQTATQPTSGSGNTFKSPEFPEKGTIAEQEQWLQNRKTQAAVDRMAQEHQAKDAIELHGKVNNAATTAQSLLPQIKLIEKVINDPEFRSGTLADLQGKASDIGRRLGLGKGELATLQQAFEKFSSGNILGQIRESLSGLGQVRSAELNLLQNSNTNLNNTPDANRAIVEVIKRTLNQSIKHADLAQEYADKHGGIIDAGFSKEYRQYLKDHPTFTDKEAEEFLPKLLGRTEESKPDASAPTRSRPNAGATPSRSEIEAEMRRRGLLK